MRYPSLLHHGAVSGVTGSCHQLQMDAEHALLVDCGLFQGAETSSEGRAGAGRLDIDFSLAGIRALIATHVHIDHVGRIPYLLAAGFKGPILCSEPSAKLLPIVLEGAFKLGFSRDQAKVERYLKLIEQRIVALPYKTWFNLVDSAQLTARIRLQYAGRRKHLKQVLKQALADKGAVLIPAFGIGRTQGLLYKLEDILYRKALRPFMGGEGRLLRQVPSVAAICQLPSIPPGQPFAPRLSGT